MIDPIQSLTAISPAKQLTGASETPVVEEYKGSTFFQSVFKSAIQNVKDTAMDVDHAQYLLATGQIDNPASVTIAASKYQVSVNLLIQLRNKALDAYSELTRISL